MRDHTERLSSALEVLDGLSVGDALGEALSYQYYRARELRDFSAFSDGSVRYTDDTEMAIAIVETLGLMRTIEEDAIAWSFASRFRQDPDRGYGRMARRLLDEISAGADWRDVSAAAFGGGSFGNGAAMRVAPLGAYFADELESIPEIAASSARVTHHHPEGIAGAIAVAIATATSLSYRGRSENDAAEAVWTATIEHTPASTVRDRISHARQLRDRTNEEAAREVGNGAEISAQDTVPFCIWNACRCLGDYPEALISSIEVGGDCDTNCAIVGGIVAGYSGVEAIPEQWLRVREPLKIRH